MTRPRLLDLFCCEGGAGMGYHRAGFDVVGVDITPQPRYPFKFVQADALEYLSEHGSGFDAIHASPPCQDHSALNGRHGIDHGTGDLVPATRAMLVNLGRPWVMENVPGAPMPAAVVLCGSMFGLGAMCSDGVWRQLRRHRLFEHHPDIAAWPPYSCAHVGQPIGVYGTGGGGVMNKNRPSTTYKATSVEARDAIGAPWMSRAGVSQSIPPAYTEWLGAALLACVNRITSRNVVGMTTWWDNAEQGRAARYAHDTDDRPTLAECEQDERDIQAMRTQYADAAPDYATQRARDILAELRAAVEAAKQEH